MRPRISFPIRVFRAVDRSMEPSIAEGDYLLVNTWWSMLRPGDVVVALHPHTGMYIVKRIRRSSRGGYFLVGDNAAHSIDSRSFGPVSARGIVGKVAVKV